MPELAEVEFFRKRWHSAAVGLQIKEVAVHPSAKIFRGTDPQKLKASLKGKKLLSSKAAAKQMLFRFSSDLWLGIHLGMSGDLYVREPDHIPEKHDHLVLYTRRNSLVLTDPRMFGRVRLHVGSSVPDWWGNIAPAILSPEFTIKRVTDFLTRRGRAPLKAVLLMQQCFPGIGNWMADEILWRAAIHPKQPAGSLTTSEVKRLWRECRHVCRLALKKIAGDGSDVPADLNVNIPITWLFRHRWKVGGKCPRTGTPLVHEEVGGRTTCWAPARQKLRT